MPERWRQRMALAVMGVLMAVSVSRPLAATELDVETPRLTRTPPRLIPNQAVMNTLWPGAIDREALVFIRFDVSAMGQPSNVVVLEGGFHERRFVDAAQRVVRASRFVPTTVDGMPVASTNIMPVRFVIGNGNPNGIRGVLPQFRKELTKVQKLVEAKDFAGAHFHAQWMLSEQVRLMYEYSALNATLAQTHARVGNFFEALAAARSSTARTGMVLDQYEPGGPLPTLRESDFMLGKETIGTLLRLRFVLAAAKGAYLDALRAGADAQALGVLAANDPLVDEFRNIEARVLNADVLQAEAEIGPGGDWTHEPVFRNVILRDVMSGHIREMNVACSGKTVDEAFVDGREYQLPPDADSCALRFTGEPGTKFRITEYRTPRGP